MGTALKGTVHGRVVELDESVEQLDGQRVHVFLEPFEESNAGSSELEEAWSNWVTGGPDGPIEDDDAPTFP